MTKTKLTSALFCAVVVLATSCGSSQMNLGQPIKTGSVGNGLTVKITSRDGVLRDGDNRLYLIFEDATGKTVDVESASLNFNMPAMGTMPEMNDAATLTTTEQPGVYAARVKLQMAGEWLAQIAYQGNVGKGKTVLTVSAQ